MADGSPRRPMASAATRRFWVEVSEKHPDKRGQGVGSRRTLTECEATCRTLSSGSPSAWRIARRAAVWSIRVAAQTALRRDSGVFPALIVSASAGTAAIRRWPSVAIAR